MYRFNIAFYFEQVVQSITIRCEGIGYKHFVLQDVVVNTSDMPSLQSVGINGFYHERDLCTTL